MSSKPKSRYEIGNFIRYDKKTGQLFWKDHWNSSQRTLYKNRPINKKLRSFNVNKKTYQKHIVVWFLCKGKWPENPIRHINGDLSDNRIENLLEIKGELKTKLSSNYKHGFSSHKTNRTKEYRAWRGMFTRCNSVNKKDYAYYKKKGITVCKRWKKFENFLNDLGMAPNPKHSIDRVDSNKGYYPSNVRWATQDIQCHNINKKQGTTSKYRGVRLYKNKTSKLYGATLAKTHLGCSNDEKVCAELYDVAAIRKYGEFANLNFPEKLKEYKQKIKRGE